MKDRFSNQASSYAVFRPTYPKELYDFILSKVSIRETAWDCATGNGQVARDLAPHFKKIYATDISAKQIDQAARIQNIDYGISSAEKTSFPDSTFNLITVGQALHWFELPAFSAEVERVSRPGAVLAVWGYGLLSITPEIDKFISEFYVKIIGPYWDPERKLVDNQYASITFPFKEIPSSKFNFSFEWTLPELQGYLSTWSSVQKYIQTNHADPVIALIEKIKPLFGSKKLRIVFPLFLRTFSIEK